MKKVYSVETEILQAFWCRFCKTRKNDGGGGEREKKNGRNGVDDRGENAKGDGEGLMCICVREQSCLTLFAQTGTTHYVPLPFPVSLHGLAHLHV